MSPGTDAPNRIDAKFEALRAAGRKGFIAYITAGHPTPAASLGIARTLAESGVDVLEIGIPFSDPLADGTTIQASSQCALEAGANVPAILRMVAELRQHTEVPIVLFTYLNPVYTYGFERFHKDAAHAGADGLLVLDLPPDEARRNAELSARSGLRAIRLIAPTTPPERVKTIAESAEGFIYYVSREGVTGEQTHVSDSIGARLAEIRSATTLPIAVGFGISSPEQAKAVAKDADAVVVGSAIIRRISECARNGASDLNGSVAAFVRPIAAAVHGTD